MTAATATITRTTASIPTNNVGTAALNSCPAMPVTAPATATAALTTPDTTRMIALDKSNYLGHSSLP